jgi:hypothetical protein
MKTTQKSRRCYHRVISGLERGGNFRFLTLTSSNESPDSCQRDWRVLYMRLQRRGLIQAYIKVPELSRNGKQHLHIIFRGEYIAQAYISDMWQELHKAKIVDIRRCNLKRGKKGLASYMAKYMSKENLFRYSWSWTWVWRGFCRHWDRLKRLWRYYNQVDQPLTFHQLIQIWAGFLRLKEPGPLLCFLLQWEPSKAEYDAMHLT